MSVRSLFNGNDSYFVIDAKSRAITLPADFKNFGVESDENSNRVYFKCPRFVGDNLDLTALSIRVNYQNANNDKDQYIVTDTTVDGDNVIFSWLLSRKATAYKGAIYFIVCAVKTDSNGVITNEWNTTTATGNVLSGLEVENPVIPSDLTDVVGQLLSIVSEAKEAVKVAEAEAVNAVALTPNTTYANALKGSVSGEVITVDDVSPIEHNVAVRVHGKNLFDISKVLTDGQKQVVNNGDGTITVNTSPTSAAVPIIKLTLKELAKHIEIGKTYVLSAVSTGIHKRIWLDVANYVWNFGELAVITQEMLDSLVFVYASGNSTTALVSEFQIELGSTATEYEPYVDPTTVTLTVNETTYTPDSEGKVTAVSVAPTMTLFTDTEGVTINCEYNKDANKVIKSLLDRIEALESK